MFCDVAYEVLSDSKKRKQYDAQGTDDGFADGHFGADFNFDEFMQQFHFDFHHDAHNKAKNGRQNNGMFDFGDMFDVRSLVINVDELVLTNDAFTFRMRTSLQDSIKTRHFSGVSTKDSVRRKHTAAAAEGNVKLWRREKETQCRRTPNAVDLSSRMIGVTP